MPASPFASPMQRAPNDPVGYREGGLYAEPAKSTVTGKTAAPPGYEWDQVKGRYIPIVTSARNAYETQRGQSQGGAAMSGLQSFGAPANPSQGTVPPVSYPAPMPQPTVQYPKVGMGDIPDASEAQNAAFGSAKARAGSLGRSALDSLRSEMAERGISGGGTEGRGTVDRLAAATNPLSDLNVAQQQEKLGIIQHNQDLAHQQASTMFSGNINQRGQDIGQQGTQYMGGITQRGQDLQNQQSQAALAQRQQQLQYQQQQQMTQQALSGLNRSY